MLNICTWYQGTAWHSEVIYPVLRFICNQSNRILDPTVLMKLYSRRTVQYIWYPPDTHLNFKSRENSFDHSICFICSIVLTFCPEHDSYTVVLCTKCRKDWPIRNLVMGKRDFTRFGFKKRFGRISHITQGSRCGAALRRIVKLSKEWIPHTNAMPTLLINRC